MYRGLGAFTAARGISIWHCAELRTELGARVIGLDPSEQMIDQARRNRQRALSYLGGHQHTSFRSWRAAAISCSCRRSITTCPIRPR